ncbi:hypothetical protein V1477_006919 [Vespula maculifrons]|uniref:Uncharacterized protein n=1 Tax=Vespula maculifrons TaxID=7453 RepID=A0ABD2CH34_VESMC
MLSGTAALLQAPLPIPQPVASANGKHEYPSWKLDKKLIPCTFSRVKIREESIRVVSLDGWLDGWLVGWWVGWLVACLLVCLLACLVACLVAWWGEWRMEEGRSNGLLPHKKTGSYYV